MAYGRYRLGTPEADLAAYAEWGDTHSKEQKVHAAEAAHLILWGSYWYPLQMVSDADLAVKRLFAFSGEDTAIEVGKDLQVYSWNDVDHGSVLLLLLARHKIKLAFVPAESPSGYRFWSNAISKAKAALIDHGLDGDPTAIIPTNTLLRIAPLDTPPGMLIHSTYASASRVTSGGNL